MTARQPRLGPGECRPMVIHTLGCRCARCDHEWMVTVREIGAMPTRPARCAKCKATGWWRPAGEKEMGRPRLRQA